MEIIAPSNFHSSPFRSFDSALTGSAQDDTLLNFRFPAQDDMLPPLGSSFWTGSRIARGRCFAPLRCEESTGGLVDFTRNEK